VDPERIRQILLNLVGNAVKFTEAGSVRVGLTYDHPNQTLKLEVQDTGPGMTQVAQAKLFQRFSQVDGSTTRKHGGTGLGLAICKGLSEAMNGQIGVTSSLGQGSTFFLQIPARITQPKVAAEDADGPPISLDGVRVLVVDDNSINRELARALLEAVGAEVSEAEDGESGVELAAFEPVDVILLDIHMPGMGGVEALAAIRAEPGPNQDIPILAFSADSDLTSLGETRDFNGIVRKPITPMDLIGAVSQCMEWTPGSEQLEQDDAAA
jgi:CheY-like chemotaxis protein